VDNESARAAAEGLALIIDQWECINCGTCVENTETVFALPDDAKAVVIRQRGDMELIQDAIDACPVTCIHWTDEPDQFEQINDADGNPIT
jgi:ferredoxin